MVQFVRVIENSAAIKKHAYREKDGENMMSIAQ
jgi:hypothetical protein